MRAILALLFLGLASCAAEAPVAREAAPEVRVARVGSSESADSVTGTGTVALRRETSLGFTSPGRVASLSVNEGDTVRAGQRLAALDATTVSSDLSSARAERERAAAEYRRSARLLEQGWVTRGRVDDAKAALGVADARVRASGFQSSNAVIIAPGSGTVLARLAEPGQVVEAGTPVLILGETSSGYVLRVPLADRDAERVRIGAPATVTFGPAAEVRGQVVEIAGRADRSTGAFIVEIALPGDAALRSGRIGGARIVAGGMRASLAVPAAAIVAPRAGEAFVYVLDPSRKLVRLRKVTIGEANDTAIAVTGGLRAGELVATSRVDRLHDGMAVRAIGLPR